MTQPSEVVSYWRGIRAKRSGMPSIRRSTRTFAAALRPRGQQARRWCLRSGWEATPEGALALMILLDQFPRNMFRGSCQILLRRRRRHAVLRGAPSPATSTCRLGHAMREFFYTPLMHSEATRRSGLVRRADRRTARWQGQARTIPIALGHRDQIRPLRPFPSAQRSAGAGCRRRKSSNSSRLRSRVNAILTIVRVPWR